eukprot:5492903-Pleurochrysis_carterae.AAC.1
MSCRTAQLLSDARRVLMYLYHHRGLWLGYATFDRDKVRGYSDSDWGARHSTSGYVILYGQAAIFWASKKQPTATLSLCEAEIVAASEATKETVYLRTLFSKLDTDSPRSTSLSMDNMCAIDLVYNPEHYARTKRIDRRHDVVRERVETLEITVPFVQSADNMAHFFITALPPRAFFPLRDHIMNVDR